MPRPCPRVPLGGQQGRGGGAAAASAAVESCSTCTALAEGQGGSHELRTDAASVNHSVFNINAIHANEQVRFGTV